MRDHSTSRSRGFGFVTFDTEQAVDDLLAQGNKLELAGAQVSWCLQKSIPVSQFFVKKKKIHVFVINPAIALINPAIAQLWRRILIFSFL